MGCSRLLSILAQLALSHAAGMPARDCLSDRMVMGVDYYPEQWPLEDMKGDMSAIKSDLGADLIRIGEFMWHEIEPEDGVFNFTFLDTVLANAEEVGLDVMLGTPTATMPAWLYQNHPDVVQQGPDSADGYVGAKAGFAGRRQYSFNSDTYQHYVRRLVERLADRYGQRKSVVMWQVDNELGHEGSDLDFSDAALEAWQLWLNRTYSGNIGTLNTAWGTMFWGATYNKFTEVPLPHYTVPGGDKRWNENFRSNSHPGMLLDYRRFRRDSIAAFSNMQVSILRNRQVKGCITTNAMGGFWGKALDHNDIFASMDFAAYDNYPVWGGSIEPTSPSLVALYLDIARGWGASINQTRWMVAEQLIGAQGHDVIGYTPRPGQAKGWAAASLLHGATAISFFRYRAAVFGQEQFCYAILDHNTPRGTGRKWQEVKDLYQLARDHDQLWLAPVQSQIALLYSDENTFAWQAQPQSTQFSFETEAHRLFYPFWRNGATVDVLSWRHLLKERSVEEAASALAAYRVFILPASMVTSEELIALLQTLVQMGRSLWMSFRADLKDTRSQVRRTPSRLAAMAGAEIAEIESLNDVGGKPVQCNVTSTGEEGVVATASVWREGLRVRREAEALWRYNDNFFGKLNYAAVTRLRSSANSSECIYIGTGMDAEALVPLASATLQRQGVPTAGRGKTPNIEQALRRDRDGQVFQVTINHESEEVPMETSPALQPFEVRISRYSGASDSILAEEMDAVQPSQVQYRRWGPWTEVAVAGFVASTALGVAWMRSRRGGWAAIMGATPELLL